MQDRIDDLMNGLTEERFTQKFVGNGRYSFTTDHLGAKQLMVQNKESMLHGLVAVSNRMMCTVDGTEFLHFYAGTLSSICPVSGTARHLEQV